MKIIFFLCLIFLIIILFLYFKPIYPLISAICITRKRPKFLKRAIENFLYQTYPNKELVIVYDEDDIDTISFLKNIKNKNIRKIKNKDQKQRLGSLRNLGIKKATGDYVIQWDDDDEYNPDRMKVQYEYIKKKGGNKACVLKNWYIYDNQTDTQYLSYSYPWEGSIMAPKKLIQKYPYPDLPMGEDTYVKNALLDNDELFMIDRPDLYIYHLHYNNTWDREHGLGLIKNRPIIKERFVWQKK